MGKWNRKSNTAGAGTAATADAGSNSSDSGNAGNPDGDTGLPITNGNSPGAVAPEAATVSGDSVTAKQQHDNLSRSRPNAATRNDNRNAARNRRAATAAQATENLAVAIVSAHYVAANVFTHNKALEMSPEQARKLADAIHRVNMEFDVALLSPKAAALVNLAIVSGGIYGNMAMQLFFKPKPEPQTQAQPEQKPE